MPDRFQDPSTVNEDSVRYFEEKSSSKLSIPALNNSVKEEVDKMTAPVESYPAQITIFCDDCGFEDTRDYLVSENDSQETRFEYARTYLAAKQGWCIIPDHIDLCNNCSGSCYGPED